MPAHENNGDSAPAEERRFYYADGERIPLFPSRQFVTARRTGDTIAGTALRALGGTDDPYRPPGLVMDLPEHDLVVLRVPEAPGASPDRARSLVDQEPELDAGPLVYETTATPEQAALIPTGEVLVKFQDGVDEDQARATLDERGLELRRVDYPEPGAYLAATDDAEAAIDVANELHELDEVEYAQPNFAHLVPRLTVIGEPSRGTLDAPVPLVDGDEDSRDPLILDDEDAVSVSSDAPAAPPNDPAYASQWALRKIRAPQAFKISMGSPSIAIAIVDEGNDIGHEDILHKLPGYDAYDGDNHPAPMGDDAHGTACAGIAAATAGNGKGGVGVAPKCRILPIRIAQGVGGGFWDTTDAKVADGIRTAVDRGADVLSNSYSVSPSSAVTNALGYAQQHGRGGKGCPMAAATGNGDVRGVIYPARLSPTIRGLLAVGASNEWDERKSSTSRDGEHWWGSNFGPEVDVVAPGVHIHTTDISGSAGYSADNYAPTFNGTSSATPHVAGLMGLILSVDPDLRSWEVEDIIKLTADDRGAPGRDEEFGFGRINCQRALEAASRMWYRISVRPVFLGSGRDCYLRASLRVINPGINTVRLDSLTLTSHNPGWTREIDRFEFRPNPGPILQAQSGHETGFRRVLLRANGNRSKWSHRWSVSYTYTFWRPSSPGFPLSPPERLGEAEGRRVTPDVIRGERDGGTADPSSMAGGEPTTEPVDLPAGRRGTTTISITVS